MEKKKKITKKNYNKHKFPIYYGIHLEIEEERKLLESVKNSIDKIYDNFKEDFSKTYEIISELIKRYDESKKGNEDNTKQNNIIEVNKMKYPKTFHITTAFGGKKGFNQNSSAVKEFNLGKKVEFKILGLVVIPEKMVITPIKAEFHTENIFAHFTTFIGDLKPVQSNDILENLFSDGQEMENDYDDIIEGKSDECCKKVKVNIDGGEYDGYIYLNGKNSNLEGRMKEYYF